MFGYEYAIGFPRARDAVKAYTRKYGAPDIPSNCCPALYNAVLANCSHTSIMTVDPNTGVARNLPVQMYGYRQIVPGAPLEIDPLMTGILGRPFAKHSIISFGWNKTLELGSGGILLTNDPQDVTDFPDTFPQFLIEPLENELGRLWETIRAKWLMQKYWDQNLGDGLVRIPQETVIPWRIIRRVPDGKRDTLVKALRAAGFHAGTNYPPLAGVTDIDAITWGDEVINLWGPHTDVKPVCEIIKRVMDPPQVPRWEPTDIGQTMPVSNA